MISYLPVSHIAAQMMVNMVVGHAVWGKEGAWLMCSISVYFIVYTIFFVAILCSLCVGVHLCIFPLTVNRIF